MHRLPLALVIVLLGACGDRAADGSSGVRGQVLAGPQCPVVEAGSPCPDLPFEGVVIATDADGEVATTETDAEGRFALSLAPGTYTLVAGTGTSATMPAGVPLDVAVIDGTFEDVTLSVDTGIR